MPSIKLKPGQRRSQNEYNFESELKKRNIKYEYEPETIIIFPEFRHYWGKVSPITYTPDYKLYYNGRVIWVEVKGFARAEDFIKEKLAAKYFADKGEIFTMVSNFGTYETGTKAFYRYNKRSVVTTAIRRIKDKKQVGTNIPTFWDELQKITK